MHTLPQLPYSYDALEPHLDARTMEIHHTKHHQAYVNNLNKTLESYPELQDKSLIELIKSLDKIPEAIRTTVRNNAGGHFSHSLYWEIMAPGTNAKPEGELLSAIEKSFGSFENFKTEFSDKATTFFGSGWIWLTLSKAEGLVLPARQSFSDGGSGAEGLKIISTQGHDNPIMIGEKPLMVIDVWEHAYYLKFQNRRQEFIESWWNVVNWEQVEKNLNAKIYRN